MKQLLAADGSSVIIERSKRIMTGVGLKILDEIVHLGDIFISATGNKHAIGIEHMKKMKNGAILANAVI
ncbi:MAG: hypothetical protein Ct9H90mP20_2340 [Candidatus Neomarinimicrobiota bacterium]|nr:MAG: hypothetical protein Ct9H90mP20_2340 [Candidatus Neomarinimicrobiota bacterium]